MIVVISVFQQDNPEDMQTIDSCEYIWEAGVGFAHSPHSSPAFDQHRMEILKLIMTCFSETMYLPPVGKTTYYVVKYSPAKRTFKSGSGQGCRYFTKRKKVAFQWNLRIHLKHEISYTYALFGDAVKIRKFSKLYYFRFEVSKYSDH